MPKNLVSPASVMLNACPPLIVALTVFENCMAVPVKAVSAPKVTAPVYVCVPEVVMLLAKVLTPPTVRLELPIVLLIKGLVPLMVSAPTVVAFCMSTVAQVVVQLVAPVMVRLPDVAPKVPLTPVTTKVPPVIVVPPV